MANPLNRITTRLQDAAKTVRLAVTEFFQGKNPEKNVEPEIFTPPPTDETVIEEGFNSTEAEAAYISSNESFEPEEPDDFGEEIDNSGDIELENPNFLDQGNLRRIFVSLADAEEYMADIPVPARIFRRSTDRLFQVEIQYP